MPPGESEGKACFAWRPEGTPQVMGSVGDRCCVESQVVSGGFCMQGSDGQGVMWWVMVHDVMGHDSMPKCIQTVLMEKRDHTEY